MKRRATLVAVSLALVAAGSALGQAAPPPPIGTIEKPNAFIYYLVAIVLMGATVLLSIMPAKRREQ